MLRAGEDQMGIGQILLKAQPTIDHAAKTALLTRQFMRGLPRNMKIKLLEHDPVPNLQKMLSFVQRYGAIQDYSSDSCNATTASNNDGNPGSTSDANATSELTRLVALVSDMAEKQQHIDSKMNRLEQSEQRRRDQMARDSRQR